MLTWGRGISSFAETLFPVTRYTMSHSSLYPFKCRSMFCVSPQPKSPVGFAEILVQPPPQSSAREQQQARVDPRGDRQSQRADGAGEQCVCVLCFLTRTYCTATVIQLPSCCRPLQDVSCNEIQALPAQVGRLLALRELNIRKNCLHMLPEGQSNSPVANECFVVFFRNVPSWHFLTSMHSQNRSSC